MKRHRVLFQNTTMQLFRFDTKNTHTFFDTSADFQISHYFENGGIVEGNR